MSVAIKTSPLGGITNHGTWKRKASDDEDEQRGETKKAKHAWYVTLESESPEPTDEDEESIYTVQGNETEFAHDTTDTSTTHSCHSESESGDSIHMEYELDSASEGEDPFLELSSSSEPENILEVEFVSFSESEGLADDSDISRGSTGSNIGRTDFRICIQCKNINNNPLFRYCGKCYQVKKSQYPRSKPKKRSRTNNKDLQSGNLQFQLMRKKIQQKDQILIQELHQQRTPRNPSIQSASAPSSQELTEMDSGIVSSQCDLESGIASSQDLEGIASDLRTSSRMSQRDEVDSGHAPTEGDSDHSYAPSEGSTGLNLTKDKTLEFHTPNNESKTSRPLNSLARMVQQRHYRDVANDSGSSGVSSANASGDAPKGASTSISEGELSTSSTSMQCHTCQENQKNGVFVHGKTCHVFCCYKCAKKVWISNKKRCPICNRQVTQILKLFYQ